MRLTSKVALVVAGYVLACIVAAVAVNIYIAASDGPDRQLYSGMSAFGDSILFLGIFGVAAVPATGLALFFLRPYPTFWRIMSAGALAVAATGAAALVVYLAFANTGTGTPFGIWLELSPLRFFLAPLFAIAFFVCMLFAPTRAPRIAFLCASAIEAIVFVWVALIWFGPFR